MAGPGARQAGMRAVLLPHSVIPEVQHGHTMGKPHAVIQCRSRSYFRAYFRSYFRS
jgi:hypothetical protein